jgi:hypothetical protein
MARIERASTKSRPVLADQRSRVVRVLDRLGATAHKVPWLFVASGSGFVAFGFDVWRPLGFLALGIVCAVAELAGDSRSV